MEPLELAWAAGFFDGEGCTMLRVKGENAHVVCCITQKDRRVLDRFLAAVGDGRIYKSRNGTTPWRWQTTSEPATRRVLALLWPYMAELKREQAQEKLDASTWHDGHRDQLRCKDASHEIVPRGDGSGRVCRTCRRAYMAARRAA